MQHRAATRIGCYIRFEARRQGGVLAPGGTEDAHGSFYELLMTAESSLKVLLLHTIMRR